MSFRINHNLAALNAHRNLLMTNESLAKSMQRLSSGYRINQGADDPAGLVISEQFRAQIAGLNRAVQNSEGSINMIQTAEGALTEINALLVSMRELAIHAANEGFNDADQLAADQAEIKAGLETIDRIAANTQFGTKKLLDGTKENVATINGSNTSLMDIKSSNLSTGTHYVSAVKTSDPSATLNSSAAGFALAGTGTDGDPVNLANQIYAINVVQASDAASKTSTAGIDIVDDFGNGITFAGTAVQAVMGSVAVVAATGQAVYTFNINYQENGGSPTGLVTLNVTWASAGTSAQFATDFNTALTGTALEGKIAADATGGVFKVQAINSGADYSLAFEAVTALGTDGSTTNNNQLSAVVAGDSRGVSDNRLSIERVSASTGAATTTAFTLGAGEQTTMAGLVTLLNTAVATAVGDVKGTTTSVKDMIVELEGSDQVKFSMRDQGSFYKFRMTSADATTASAVNVLNINKDAVGVFNTGQDAIVTLDGYANSVDKVDYDSSQAYTWYSAASGDADRGSVSVNVVNNEAGLSVGSYLLDVTATKFSVGVDGGTLVAFTAGEWGTVYNADRSESITLKYGLTSTGGSESITNTDQSLVFQIGANVGQTTKISLRNMTSTSLGKNLTGNQFANLSTIDVTSAQGAQDAQSVIDAAMNEVSTTRGTLGSFQKNTLESNLRNLRVAAQNLTASESQIRDTDMAREMATFSMNQILVQAGTAMLAQANQIPQIVLSLF